MTSLIQGNAVKIPLADESVQCVVTSPPYWGLRDYGLDGRGLGLEPTPEQYIANMVSVFREVRRVLRSDGVLWLNMGDSYANSRPRTSMPDQGYNSIPELISDGRPVRNWSCWNLKPKDLAGIPWRLALALQADGWWLRQYYPWVKINSMPESATDRPNNSLETVFLLTKAGRYFFDMESAKECLAIKRNWRNGDGLLLFDCPTQSFGGSHFATFPEELIKPMIASGTSEQGCCPECGAPWERVVEKVGKFQRRWSTNNAEGSPYNQQDSYQNEYKQVGWHPTCDHYDDLYRRDYPKARSARKRHQRDITGDWWKRVRKRPGFDHWNTDDCKVFDPFAGSGTTLLVARQLGRYGVGLDLSAEYLTLARARLSLDKLEAWENGGTDGTTTLDGMPLFEQLR
jgi:DNA modification methylase